MRLQRTARKYVDLTVTATLRDGRPAGPLNVSVALLPILTAPTAATTWQPVPSATDGTITLLLAGPDADPAGALPVPRAGADLWARVLDTPETDVVLVDRIDVR